VLGGVCGGIAEHFDIDPVFVRLGAVALAILIPPIGVVGYVVAWIITPVAPGGAPAAPPAGTPVGGSEGGPAGEPSRAAGPASPAGGSAAPSPAAAAPEESGLHASAIAGVILVGIGVFFLAVEFGLLDRLPYLRWRYLWPLALIALGVSMVFRALRPRPAAGPPSDGR
jgi:phage shock protein PspC (stress-responsive transcriptional regulator)